MVDYEAKYEGRFPSQKQILLATLIDLILFNIVGIGLGKAVHEIFESSMDRYTLGKLTFGIYCLCVLYFPICTSFAQTIGQKIVGLKILDGPTGKNLPLPRAVFRWFLAIFSIGGYGMRNVPKFDEWAKAVLVKK